MTIENFTSYTEVDPSGQLSETSSRVTYTALSRAADAYISYDFGAGYFTGSAYLEGAYLISAGTGASPKSASIGFTDSLNDAANTTNQVGAYHWLDGTNATVQDYVYLRESSVYAGATISPTLSLSTNYFYRTGFLSSLGQYGGAFTQVFSDSGLTTLIASGAKARAAAATYRYVIAGQSYTTGGAMTITGYDENVTVYQPAAGIDLTTGVETDTGTSRLDVYADCIVATALNIANGETAKHVAVDKGAGFFGDYKVSGVLNVTSFTNGTVVQMFDILAVTDAASDAGVANDLQGVSIYYASASTYKPYIHQAIGGADTFSTVGPTLNTNQPYSFTLERSGTTLTLKVWNDLVLDANLQGASQVGSTLTWTGRATTTYRYLMPVASYLNGATSRSSTFTFGGVRISVVGEGTLAGNVVVTSSIVGAGSTENALTGDAVVTAAFVGASEFSGTLAGNAVVTASIIGQELSAGSANLAGTVVATALFVGASEASGTLAGNAVTTALLIADTTPSLTILISCRIPKLNSTGQEVGATGLTPTIKVWRASDKYYRDFSDNTFKPIASCVTLTANMDERNAPLAAGRYDYTLQAYGLGAGTPSVYGYDIDATISSGSAYMNEGSITILDGVEVLGGLTVAENTTLNAVPTAVLAAATSTPIAADIKKVNGTSIDGAGSAADPWGPV